jgi:hypothetical protein
MANPRDINIDIVGHDQTGRATASAARNFERLDRRVKAASRSTKDAGKGFDAFRKTAERVAITTGRVTSVITAAAGAAISAGLGITKAVIRTTRALAAVGPAAATLPAVAGSLGLIYGTARLAGPGIVKALEPVTAQFMATDKVTSSLARDVQRIATRGLPDLARGFVRVNMPAIGSAMKSIAGSMNVVMVRVGQWVNSTAGQATIRDISQATATAMARLAPHLAAVVIAFGNLVRRAGDPAIRGLGGLLSRVADATTRFLNSITSADIAAAIGKLKDAMANARTSFARVKEVVEWIINHQAELKAIATGLQLTALATALASGNWAAAVVAAFALVVTNWETIKSTFNKAKPWWDSVWQTMSNDPYLRSIAGTVRDAVQSAWNYAKTTFNLFAPKFSEVTGAWRDAWEEWGPIVSEAFRLIKPVLIAIGIALALLATQILNLLTITGRVVRGIGVAFKVLVVVVAGIVGTILSRIADLAEGFAGIVEHIPGGEAIAAPLRAGAAKIRGIVSQINAETARIVASRTVSVNVGVYYRQYGDDRAAAIAQSRAIRGAMASGSAWTALDGAGQGRGRNAQPVNNTFQVDSRVFLDGAVLDARARTIVAEREGRTAFRARAGRR